MRCSAWIGPGAVAEDPRTAGANSLRGGGCCLENMRRTAVCSPHCLGNSANGRRQCVMVNLAEVRSSGISLESSRNCQRGISWTRYMRERGKKDARGITIAGIKILLHHHSSGGAGCCGRWDDLH